MKSKPVALTIAGSDSGGGAGIQADLKTFQATGTFGTSALTCLTAQNPDSVTAIFEVDPDFLEKQIRAVFDYFPVAVVKTGMLYSESLIKCISSLLIEYKNKGSVFKLVVDPVMVSTSGAKLLRDDAIVALKEKLISMADLITPNLDETFILGNIQVSELSEMDSAAHRLAQLLGRNVLLKGGHLTKSKVAIDVLAEIGKPTISFSKPFVSGFYPHGTGCTYSSAIASYWTQTSVLADAVRMAKEYLHSAITQAYSIGRSNTLNHSPE
ncbi:bifunctional hydroxymethylpyrimidine kinase/phosphomethylpyrimidine kinase [Leptospira perolatii]|uniref:hydroxymethylpyrimidine kinase n=2 Tax=Leptospira perolatii TaxID=2023191 RepID=A0A2M9ZRD0_9LEPT|nr:bifunctional hydroxymethylpyrimidine kinase/phosphomethylpyrimidine kinase [Leptospira perolatii]PJZ74638.1 bifunctional hydroxymethylpyrimidine kinase/phosphomethylpyrimidine kinase [Leptospira perolatii]